MRAKRVLQLCVVLSCLAIPGFSQTSGSIGGVVRDQTGAVVPNASVMAVNPETGVPSRVTSLADGKYLINNLSPGKYDLTVEVTGFKSYTSKGLEVHVSDKLTIDIPLQLGEARDTVTVTDEAPLLRTEDAQTGEVINNTFIANLPQLNRNPFALLALSGDVAGSGSGVALNGGRTLSVDYYVDGGVINSGQGNSLTNQTPSMDAVAEFKVVTSGISAEFGRISGGYVTLVTKQGTNAYHGSLYEYMFNDMANANAWAQNAIGNPKVHFRQNDYGFTAGGPVTLPKIYSGKNRTFFFVDNEYLKKTQAGSITLAGVPNALERSGDLSKSLYQGKLYPAYDPYGPQSAAPAANGFYERLGLLGGDGYHVPASLISPVATAILSYVPMPNRPSTAGSSSLNDYGFASSLKLDTFRFGARVDETLTDRQRLNIRYSTYSSNQATTPTMENALYTSNVAQSNGGIAGNINYTWTATPTLIVDLRNSGTFQPTLTGATHAADFNNSFLPAIYQKYLGTNDIQTIANSFMNGTAYAQPGSVSVINSTSYNFGGTITKVMARHTIKAGYEYRRYYDNFLNAGGSTNTTNFMTDPVFRYQGDWGNGAVEGRVNGMASYLLGINDRNNVAQPTTRAMNTNYVGAFVQDDWKVNDKLTLNLGLRWDNERPTTERGDKIYFWDAAHPSLFPIIPGFSFTNAVKAAGIDPATIPAPSWVANGFDPGAVMLTNSSEFKSRSPQTPRNLQFAPRIGLAYQVDKKTVVRAFGGKMFLGTTGNPNSYATANSAVPLSDQALAGWHASTDGGRHYISTWATPFPLPSMFTNYTRDIKTINQFSSADPGATVVNGDLHMPREYDWSVNIQRQLPQNFIVEVGYTGNRGLGLLATDLISHYPANLLVPQYAVPMQKNVASPNAGETFETTITGSIQQLGLLEYQYPYYGRVQVSGINEGTSFYNALTVRAEHRLSRGVQVLVNYTYSKSLDNVGGPDGGGKQAQSVSSFHEVWGLSTNDQKHRLNIAYTAEFPIGRGRQWLNSPTGFVEKAIDTLIGGWQLAGNYAYNTGTPITLSGTSTGNINNGIKVNQTTGTYASSDHNLTPSTYGSDSQILYSPVDPIPTISSATAIRRLDPTKVVTAQLFVVGNLPYNDTNYRQPSFYQMDMSLSKNFTIREGWKLQIRGEAQNAWNIRGFGAYNSSVGSNNYGLITSAGNSPRQIQMSARINF